MAKKKTGNEVTATWVPSENNQGGQYVTEGGWTMAYSGAWYIRSGEKTIYLGFGDADPQTETDFAAAAIALQGGPRNGTLLGYNTAMPNRKAG